MVDKYFETYEQPTYSQEGDPGVGGLARNTFELRELLRSSFGRVEGEVSPGAGSANRVAIFNGSGVLSSDSDLTFDGTDLSVGGTIVQPAWADVTVFYNSWGNYGGDFQVARYFRDKCGIVHIEGLLKNDYAAGRWGISMTTFQLPSGYLPDKRLVFLNFCQTSPYVGRVDVDVGGQVYAVSGAGQWLSVSGISFRATGY